MPNQNRQPNPTKMAYALRMAYGLDVRPAKPSIEQMSAWLSAQNKAAEVKAATIEMLAAGAIQLTDEFDSAKTAARLAGQPSGFRVRRYKGA